MSDFELTTREWDVIARVMAREVRRFEARAARSTFVPEPGRKDMTKAHLMTSRTILEKVRRKYKERKHEEAHD